MKKFDLFERVFLFTAAAVTVIGLTAFTTLAFTGPNNSGGVGSGAISSDASNNLGVGTSSTSGTTKLYVVASSTASTSYALRIVQPNATDILSVRNDGLVSIAGIFSAGSFTGTVSSGNLSAGQFGQNTGGGNYSFPANLSVGTTSSAVPLTVKIDGAGIAAQFVGATSTDYADIAAGPVEKGFRGYGPAPVVLSNDGNIILRIGPDEATNQRVKVLSSNGYVGIGLSTPSYKLDVLSNGAATARFGTSSSDVVEIGSGLGKLLAGEWGLGTPAVDHSTNGPTSNAFQSGATLTVMDSVYMGSAGKWLQTDADAASTANGLVGIALESKNDTQLMKVALPGGFVRDDTWNWTTGSPVYLSTTNGQLTQTQPSGVDDVIRVVGWAVNADVIYFMPSPDYFTHN